MPHPNSAEVEAASLAGPVAQVFMRNEGVNAMDPAFMVFGFLHMLVSALLMGLLLRSVRGRVGSYGGLLRVALLAGFAAAVFSHLGNPIWWHQPWGYHAFVALYDFGAWAAAGLVLAAFVRVRETPPDITSAPEPQPA